VCTSIQYVFNKIKPRQWIPFIWVLLDTYCIASVIAHGKEALGSRLKIVSALKFIDIIDFMQLDNIGCPI